MKYIFYLLIFVFSPAVFGLPVFSQELKLEADKSVAEIGEPVLITLKAIIKPEDNLILKSFVLPDSIISLKFFKNDTIVSGNLKTIIFKRSITSLADRSFTLNPQNAVLEKKGFRDPVILKSNPLDLSFYAQRVDTASPPKSYYGRIEAAVNKKSSGFSLVWALAAILIIFAGLFYFIYQRKKRQEEKTLEELLLQRIKALKKKKQNLDILVESYSVLSIILNDTLNLLFNGNIAEMQNNEIAQRLEVILPKEDFRLLCRAKRHIELVQFATKLPRVEEFVEDAQAIETIIINSQNYKTTA